VRRWFGWGVGVAAFFFFVTNTHTPAGFTRDALHVRKVVFPRAAVRAHAPVGARNLAKVAVPEKL
jgi:hypothetical protein